LAHDGSGLAAASRRLATRRLDNADYAGRLPRVYGRVGIQHWTAAAFEPMNL